MAWHGVSSFRSYIVRPVWIDSSPHVMVSDMEALHALSKAMGTTTVCIPAVFDQIES